MGMFKSGWDQIKHIRGRPGTAQYPPDTLTGLFVSEQSLHFLYSVIPRCNDIGLLNDLGCTTLNCPAERSGTRTIYYLTTDDLEGNSDEYELVSSAPFNTAIGERLK